MEKSCGADFDSRSVIAARKRHAPSGPMGKILQQGTMDGDSSYLHDFFYLNFLSLNIAWSPLHSLICV